MKFQVILWNQWRWSRLVIVFGTVIAFALPILSIQGTARTSTAMRPVQLLMFLQGWGIMYPLTACALGLLVAMAAWAPDHRGRHIHTLTLPIPRWHFLLLRFAAGSTLLLLPILGLFLGAWLASKGANVPSGLRTYPFSLGFRFGLATLTAFALFYAISGGTARTAGMILGTLLAIFVVQMVSEMTGYSLHLGELIAYGLSLPGPLALFTGRWMLIDV